MTAKWRAHHHYMDSELVVLLVMCGGTESQKQNENKTEYKKKRVCSINVVTRPVESQSVFTVIINFNFR